MAGARPGYPTAGSLRTARTRSGTGIGLHYSSGAGSVSSSASARIWKLGHGQRHMQLRHLA